MMLCSRQAGKTQQETFLLIPGSCLMLGGLGQTNLCFALHHRQESACVKVKRLKTSEEKKQTLEFTTVWSWTNFKLDLIIQSFNTDKEALNKLRCSLNLKMDTCLWVKQTYHITWIGHISALLNKKQLSTGTQKLLVMNQPTAHMQRRVAHCRGIVFYDVIIFWPFFVRGSQWKCIWGPWRDLDPGQRISPCLFGKHTCYKNPHWSNYIKNRFPFGPNTTNT